MINNRSKIDFAAPRFVANPYPFYDELRESEPVSEISVGLYLVTQYDAAVSALLNKGLSNQPSPFALLNRRHRDEFVAAEVANNLIAFQEPEDATAVRKIFARELSSCHSSIQEDLLQLSSRIVEGIPPKGDFDFVSLVAIPFALQSMCNIFGLPPSDAERIKEWTGLFFGMFHSIPNREAMTRMNGGILEFRNYVSKAFEQRKGLAGSNIICALERKSDDAALQALIDNTMLMIADAVENVWAGIANSMFIMLKNKSLVNDFLYAGGNFSKLVDECLRLESPGQFQGRVALEDLEICGKKIPRYSVVLVGFAAANRDPSAFECPQEFRPNRAGPRHLTFGTGQHACIGANLARLKISSMLQAVWPICSDLTLISDDFNWESRTGHRWLRDLQIRRFSP